MKKSIVTASILTAGLIFSSSVNAATAASTLNVSASVVPSCTVSTTPVSFGNLDPSPYISKFANGDISVNCSTGIPYHIALNAGLNLDTNYQLRNMKEITGTALAAYGLYVDNGTSAFWGDSDYDNTYYRGPSVADTGNGAIQPHTVYGAASAYDTATFGLSPPGAYSDTVNVTVYY